MSLPLLIASCSARMATFYIYILTTSRFQSAPPLPTSQRSSSSRVTGMPKTYISDCVLVDHRPERLPKIPPCNWIYLPHLTHRIVDYLRANPQASAWAYHLGLGNPQHASPGTLTKLTKYVFAQDSLFREHFQADVEMFRKRMHTYVTRCVSICSSLIQSSQ